MFVKTPFLLYPLCLIYHYRRKIDTGDMTGFFCKAAGNKSRAATNVQNGIGSGYAGHLDHLVHCCIQGHPPHNEGVVILFVNCSITSEW